LKFGAKKDDLLFVPLGGASEIGMNVNLYHYKGKWIMFDLGAGFADDSAPGIDMLAPDLSFIMEQKDNFLGIVLTHAHEDHIGAVTYLWGQLGCPIYTTPFTATVVKAKMAGDGIPAPAKMYEVDSNSSFDIGPFSIELVHITHSIPEMNGAIINTEYGKVFHTGDWKIDPDPIIGPATDEDRIKAYGDDGVLAMVCDSTNVFNEGHSGSEGELLESITNLVAEQKGLVAVTTFASNVARIDTIARAAMANNREVVLLGRSLDRITRAAQETGYLEDIRFIDERHVAKIPREHLLCICTGCQGEEMAATAKLVNNAHRSIRLVPGDTIIFSSKMIPGNEKKIFSMCNRLAQNKIEVITEKDHFVHVSGHPYRDELRQMYKLIRPRVAIPVHGEPLHIHEHIKLAKDAGVPNQVEVSNGSMVRIAPGKPEVIGHVRSGYLGVDGYMLIPIDGDIIRARRKMMKEGIVFMSFTLNKVGRIISGPYIDMPGVLDSKESADFIKEIAEEVIYMVEGSKHKQDEKLATAARKVVRRFLKDEIGKFPQIKVQLSRV
jgi:ribonuclease J